jgi:hypothetical protein
MSTQKKDDLETVRLIVDSLAPFSKEEQERIFRWTAEKLAIQTPTIPGTPALAASAHPQASPSAPATGATDIKTFMAQKKPRNDVQFAAAAAYFYRFEAPPAERKEAITKDDLQEAARRANHERFTNPVNTLGNAHKLGLLDRGTEKASFVINSVGENLVAMTLPDGAPIAKPRPAKRAKKSGSKARGKAKGSTTKSKKKATRAKRV